MRASLLMTAMLAIAAGCPSGSVPANLDSGITGQITKGPICPVQGPNMPQCDDQPYAGTVVVRSRGGPIAFEVTRFTAADDGSFHLPLEPGAYTLDPQPGPNGFPHASPQDVTVEAHTFTTVNISYDTGIR